ncbi:MAG: Dodecin (COG3360) Flavin-binding, partial [uncultured Frankineae bacterium]
ERPRLPHHRGRRIVVRVLAAGDHQRRLAGRPHRPQRGVVRGRGDPRSRHGRADRCVPGDAEGGLPARGL